MTSERKGRILLVCPQCDGNDVGESWGGFRWATGLSKHYDVTMLTCLFPDAQPPSLQVPGANVVEWKAAPYAKRFLTFNRVVKPWFPNFYWQARRWLKKNATHGEFDVIHQITPMALRYPSPCAGLGLPYIVGPIAGSLTTPASFNKELGTQPVFMKLRSIDSLRLKYDPLLRQTYEDATAVICAAPYAAERLSAFKLKRIFYEGEVILDAQPRIRAQASSFPGELRLLFVGRLVRTKGARDAIRALGQLRDLPGVTLTIAGRGEELSACQAECADLGLESRVKFLGHRPHNEIETLYGESDAFLFPSFREPTGIVLYEAMNAGLPVITADFGGPVSIVDEASGFRVPVTSPDAFVSGLAAAIRRLALEPGLRTKMSAAAVNRARLLTSWPEKFGRIAKLYEEISGIKPHPDAA